jgi:hypothetical protein
VLFGGGGGTSGTGIDSGAVVCEYSAEGLGALRPIGRLETRDTLVAGMAVHPTGTAVAMAIGGRTYLLAIRDGDRSVLTAAAFPSPCRMISTRSDHFPSAVRCAVWLPSRRFRAISMPISASD